MKKWILFPLMIVLIVILFFSPYLFQNFSEDEKIILSRAGDLPLNEQLELRNALNDNNEVRKTLLQKFITTNDTKYNRSYVDAGYTIKVFSRLAKERNLTSVELKILITTLQANNAYYTIYTSPTESRQGTFSSKAPFNTYLIINNTKFTSKLPFVYYDGQGWQLYPVTSTFWASVYFERGDYQSGMEILDELSQYMGIEEYNGMKYGVFKVYFQYVNSSVPWASSYSQGMATGLYAQAYNKTKDKKYLDQSKLLFNSFKIPLNESGFIAHTKYGNWFLEYNFKPNHLILNGHIITMKGIYTYYQVTGDPLALKLFKNGTKSVKAILPELDTGHWSYYALTGKDEKPAWEATEYYHGLHVELLRWLYATTGDAFFNQYASRWEVYLENKKN